MDWVLAHPLQQRAVREGGLVGVGGGAATGTAYPAALGGLSHKQATVVLQAGVL